MFLKMLNKNRKEITIVETSEYDFLKSHMALLDTYKIKYSYRRIIDLVQSNIVLRGLLNKIELEKSYIEFENANMDMLNFMSYQEKRKMINYEIGLFVDDLPSFIDEKTQKKIVIPFFEEFANTRYLDDISIFSLKQHSAYLYSFNQFIKNPFDLYGYQVFKSNFTKLSLVCENEKVYCFYFDDLKCIFVFRKDKFKLTNTIYIVDKYSNKEDFDIEEIKVIASMYANYRFKDMLEYLHDKKYLSDKTYEHIYKKCRKKGIS